MGVDGGDHSDLPGRAPCGSGLEERRKRGGGGPEFFRVLSPVSAWGHFLFAHEAADLKHKGGDGESAYVISLVCCANPFEQVR